MTDKPAQSDAPSAEPGMRVMEAIWEDWKDAALGIEFPPTSHEEAFCRAAHQIDCAIAALKRDLDSQVNCTLQLESNIKFLRIIYLTKAAKGVQDAS